MMATVCQPEHFMGECSFPQLVQVLSLSLEEPHRGWSGPEAHDLTQGTLIQGALA